MTSASRRIAVPETALLLFPALTFFSICTGLWHIEITAGILCGLSLLLPKAFKVTDRAVIYSVVAAMVLTVLEDSAWPMTDYTFSFLAALLHPEWIVPVLVYSAIFFTIFQTAHLAIGTGMAAAVCMLAFCGELRIFGQLAGLRTDLAVNSTVSLYGFYAVLAVTFFLSLWSLRRHGAVPGHAAGRRLGVLLTTGMLLLTAAGIRYAAGYYADELRNLENLLLQDQSASHWRHAVQLFDQPSVDIRTTLGDAFRRNESEIAFHVNGTQVPGYLRGRGFCSYEFGGKWTSPATAELLPARPGPGLVNDHCFDLRTAETKPAVRWTVFPAVRNQGRIIYYPGRTVELQMLADKAYLAVDGTLTVGGGKSSAGYTLLADSNAAGGGPLTGDPEKIPSLRHVPPELRAVLQEVCYAAGISRGERNAVCFRKLLNFFYDNFRYSLSPEPENGDPVEHFLLRTRRGHCELFASAMTLTLRSLGIPARYVTGFICDEPHRSGRSFIARMGNAHAWVEAFDRDRHEWVLLDPTPAIPPLPGRNFETARQYWECAAWCGQEFFALLRRGHMTEAINTLWSGLWEFLRETAASWQMLPCWCILIAAGGWLLRRRFLRNAAVQAAPDKRKLIRKYHRFLWRMYFSGRIPWFSRPTAAEMIRHLAAAPPDAATLQKNMSFLREYCVLRYRPSDRPEKHR